MAIPNKLSNFALVETKSIIERMSENLQEYDFAMNKIRTFVEALPPKQLTTGGIIEEIEKYGKSYEPKSSEELIKYFNEYEKNNR